MSVNVTDVPPLPFAGDGNGLSEYEAERLQNIAANQQFLRELGLATNATPRAPTSGSSAKKSRRKEAAAEAVQPLRRSARARNQAPDYTGEHIDTFGEDNGESSGAADAEGEIELRRPAVEVANDEAIERCRAATQQQQQQLQEIMNQLASQQDGDTNPHLQLAIARWGPRVFQAGRDIDWVAYVASRTSTPPSGLPSPYALLQERYAYDVWTLLVACILMSRVSSIDVKERCLYGFFAMCPTPSAFVDTDPAELLPVIKSLGLFPNRLAAIVDLTQRFLSMPVFEVSLEGENKIKGVGEFGYHSYLLFCKDEPFVPVDKNLQAFAYWRASLGRGATVKEEPPSSPVQLEAEAAVQKVKTEREEAPVALPPVASTTPTKSRRTKKDKAEPEMTTATAEEEASPTQKTATKNEAKEKMESAADETEISTPRRSARSKKEETSKVDETHDDTSTTPTAAKRPKRTSAAQRRIIEETEQKQDDKPSGAAEPSKAGVTKTKPDIKPTKTSGQPTLMTFFARSK